MPAVKRRQVSPVFYALLIFVVLFAVATIVAVVFYITAEEHRTEAVRLQTQINGLANGQEQQNITKIIGTQPPGRSALGIMTDYLDQMVADILGGPLEPTTAEVKVNNARKDVNDVFGAVGQSIGEKIDPNTSGLVPIMRKLKTQLDNTVSSEANLKKLLAEQQQRADDIQQASKKTEDDLKADTEKYFQQVQDLTAKYEELKKQLEQSSEQRAQNFKMELEKEKTSLKETNDELLKTRAELLMAQGRLKRTLQELDLTKPRPASDALAYKPDGKVILVDEQAGVVHLNLGIDDRVYRGLTFSVYDKSGAVPKSGLGKAEIEVFGLEKSTSTARIIRSESRNPIATGDLIINLIWDSDKSNVFVVAGDFDLNGDKVMDYDAVDKIKTLIEKWGSSVKDDISIDTDYVVLGEPPDVPRKPTFEDLAVNPLAMQQYDAAEQKLRHYQQVQESAETLWIPIFNYERFLYFIGYKELSNKPGAF